MRGGLLQTAVNRRDSSRDLEVVGPVSHAEAK
jgi:hypothetical protein